LDVGDVFDRFVCLRYAGIKEDKQVNAADSHNPGSSTRSKKARSHRLTDNILFSIPCAERRALRCASPYVPRGVNDEYGYSPEG
jgi:hypothetical protein